MILSNILFELKRIANALEVLADTKLESLPKGEAPVTEFFDSRVERENEETLHEDRFAHRINEELKAAHDSGLFFEEDGVSEELLERL